MRDDETPRYVIDRATCGVCCVFNDITCHISHRHPPLATPVATVAIAGSLCSSSSSLAASSLSSLSSLLFASGSESESTVLLIYLYPFRKSKSRPNPPPPRPALAPALSPSTNPSTSPPDTAAIFSSERRVSGLFITRFKRRLRFQEIVHFHHWGVCADQVGSGRGRKRESYVSPPLSRAMLHNFFLFKRRKEGRGDDQDFLLEKEGF